MREGFDPGNAITWNAEEHAVYDTGYKEGTASRDVDWHDALEDTLEPFLGTDWATDVDWGAPYAVAQVIAEILRKPKES